VRHISVVAAPGYPMLAGLCRVADKARSLGVLMSATGQITPVSRFGLVVVLASLDGLAASTSLLAGLSEPTPVLVLRHRRPDEAR
jgi:hypothetical protein